MYDEDGEIDENFKMGVDEDEPLDTLDIPDKIDDFGLDEEDPDKDS